MQVYTVHFRHLQRKKKPVGGGERSWMLCGMSLWAWLDSGSPGLLVGAQAAHCAVPGTTAYTGIRGWEATYSTERALGSGWGTGTSCQVVGTFRRTQVLLLQQSLEVFPEAKLEMVTSSFLLFLSCVCIIIKLRQPLAQLGEACVGVILEIVVL